MRCTTYLDDLAFSCSKRMWINCLPVAYANTSKVKKQERNTIGKQKSRKVTRNSAFTHEWVTNKSLAQFRDNVRLSKNHRVAV